ncbi:TPA: imidazole glycerol phosphate synthase cyclase subunit [Staphylococcus aureus]|nr:imidazole glycerol phosphate synthase cyclase subunit [Staphylococcus aureus]
MIKKRIIPCLDVKDGRVVKGIQFKGLRDIGNPVDLAMYYNEAGADELVFLDISKTEEGHSLMLEVIEQTASRLFIPLTVGGGIQSLDDITQLLNHGADKVSLNSSALKNPQLIKQASDKFGRQCICIAIDSYYDPERKAHYCCTHGGGGNAQHFVELFDQTDVSAGLAASILHDRETTVQSIKEVIRQGGIAVR